MTNKPNCWKRLSSGKYVDLNNLNMDDVSISDVETSLNHIIRFTGHHCDEEPLTVAQHSYLCYHLAQTFEPDEYELHLAVLTHDFAECVLGDVSSPVKWAMGDKWYNFAMPIEKIFEKKFLGKLVSPELHQRVKLYDLAAMDIERRVLWSSQYGKDKWPASPLNLGTIEDKQELFHSVNGYKISLSYYWDIAYKKVYG